MYHLKFKVILNIHQISSGRRGTVPKRSKGGKGKLIRKWSSTWGNNLRLCNRKTLRKRRPENRVQEGRTSLCVLTVTWLLHDADSLVNSLLFHRKRINKQTLKTRVLIITRSVCIIYEFPLGWWGEQEGERKEKVMTSRAWQWAGVCCKGKKGFQATGTTQARAWRRETMWSVSGDWMRE